MQGRDERQADPTNNRSSRGRSPPSEGFEEALRDLWTAMKPVVRRAWDGLKRAGPLCYRAARTVVAYYASHGEEFRCYLAECVPALESPERYHREIRLREDDRNELVQYTEVGWQVELADG